MDFLSSFTDLLADNRLAANLIVGHGIITVMVVVSARLRWLKAASEEASRRAGTMLFWLTVLLVLLTVIGGVGYHLAGRDIRLDLSTWYERLTIAELLAVAGAGVKLLALALGAWFAVRSVRRLWPVLEA